MANLLSGHSYSTDSDERGRVFILLFVVSIFCAWGLNAALPAFQFAFPWWLSAPSVFGFYGALSALFGRYLWRITLFRIIGLVRLPDLQGRWSGYVTSSFDEHAFKHEVALVISQTWQRISICLEGRESSSRSITAAVLDRNSKQAEIIYEYLNEPVPEAKRTMHTHRGTAHLTLSTSTDGQCLKGDYYSGRDRQNVGVLSFRRS